MPCSNMLAAYQSAWPGHSASKTRVNALYVQAIHALAKIEDVDARHKAGHDGGEVGDTNNAADERG